MDQFFTGYPSGGGGSGVSSLNALTGALSLVAGSGITITPSGSTITIAATSASPLTTKGDLFGFSTVNARIPIGSNGQILTADSTQTLGLKWAAASAGTVTSVGSGTGLTGGPITSTGTLALADTAVTPASYTNANITVDQQGRITAASDGSSSAAWVTYTPTVIQGYDVINNAVAQYCKIGNLLMIQGTFQQGTGNANIVQISIPFTSNSALLGPVGVFAVGVYTNTAFGGAAVDQIVLGYNGTSYISFGYQGLAASSATAATGANLGGGGTITFSATIALA
jgi:hypothetical protein